MVRNLAKVMIVTLGATAALSVATPANAGVLGCSVELVNNELNNPHDPIPVYVPPADIDANGTVLFTVWAAGYPVGAAGCIALGGVLNCANIFNTNPHNPVPVYTFPLGIDANGTVDYALYDVGATIPYALCVLL